MFNETSHSFVCVWGGGGGVVRERLLPCRVVVTAKWVVSRTRITCIQPLSRCSLTLLVSSFFSESVVVVLSLFVVVFPLLFPHAFFLFYLWFISHFVPAC